MRPSTFVLVAALAAAPAHAFYDSLLTFDATDTCAGGPCVDFSFVDQDYGDTPFVDVSYRSRVAPGASDLYEDSIRWWSTGYGDLDGVVWGGIDDESEVARFVCTGSRSG